MSDAFSETMKELIETVLNVIEDDGLQMSKDIVNCLAPLRIISQENEVRGNALAMTVVSKVTAVIAAAVYSSSMSILAPNMEDELNDDFAHKLSQHIQLEMMIRFSKAVEKTLNQIDQETWSEMTDDNFKVMREHLSK